MMFLKKHKGKFIAAAVIFAVLAIAYFWGGNYAIKDVPRQTDVPINTLAPTPQTAETPASTFETSDADHEPTESGVANSYEQSEEEDFVPSTLPHETLPQQKENSSEGVYEGSETYSEAQGMEINPDTGKDRYLTDPISEGKPVPVEPQSAVVTNTAYTCTLSVRCDTILQNIKYMNKEKIELVPEDGVIFPPTKVTFYEGETVFNLLQREMKKNKIHMEFRSTPIYNSAYIEGINNLYEFDVGELSGWMYKVNGWFPGYGASRYQLKAGDMVEWVYTCDLGRDVGGYYAAEGEQ